MQFSSSAITIAALGALVQLSPAPFFALIPEAVAVGMGATAAVVGAAGAVTGGVSTAIKNSQKRSTFGRLERHRRQEMNQAAWQSCHEQLASTTVNFSGPSPGNVLVSGIPSSCMTLLTVITGQYNEGNPIPEGSDSALFQNLSDDDIQTIQSALDSHA